MRPKITSSRSISRSLNYNEQKVTLGKAECLRAANFLKDLHHLTPEDKLRSFQRRMELNERVRTSLHITLNFDPSDQLSNEKMTQIADRYMKEIGFERQPYLVYRHHDAGHPHCHIVTTHVQPNGDPIELYNIGRRQSEKAKQLIEKEFQLVTTEMKKALRLQQRETLYDLRKIKYGDGSTTRSISTVLEHVTKKFKYTSFEEFNAVLKFYNLAAYRGNENTQLYQHRGLLYRVLDEHGRYIGVPLKASFFDCKPTLDNLEKQFVQNESQKQQYQLHVDTNIRWIYYSDKPNDLKTLKSKLAEKKIHMVIHNNKEGQPQKIIYVDFGNKCIFRSDELSEGCGPAALQQLIEREKQLQLEQAQNPSQKNEQKSTHRIIHYLT